MTAEKFIKNPLAEVSSDRLYRTGDQARWHRTGVIEFLGRLDHQVKVRGFRIELPEIERALETHDTVSEAIVVVLKDDNGSDPQLVGCYTVNHARQVDASALRCHLNTCLPAHMIPSMFEQFDKFPLSPNGKVDRHALSAAIKGQLQTAKPIESTTVKTLDAFLQQTWCQLLSKQHVGPEDNFFDVGGDSLQLARLHQLLETYLNRKFPITDLFAHPTIQGMTTHLGSNTSSEDRQQQVRDRARLQREALASRRRGRS